METKVIKLRDFNPKNLSFSSLRTTKHGGKIIYINYDYQDGRSPKPLRIQMPRMKTPFGISGWDKDRSDKKDSSPTENSNDTLELSVGDSSEIIQKMEDMDEIIITNAIANSKEYFKKKYAEDYIRLQYKSALKFNENEEGERDLKYPPRLKTKMYKDSSYEYRTQVFDSDKKPLKIDIYNQKEIIPKGSECIALLECAGIWVINEKFGLSWRPVQMKVFRSDTSLSGYSFIDDDEPASQKQDPLESIVEEVETEPVSQEESDDTPVPVQTESWADDLDSLSISAKPKKKTVKSKA